MPLLVVSHYFFRAAAVEHWEPSDLGLDGPHPGKKNVEISRTGAWALQKLNLGLMLAGGEPCGPARSTCRLARRVSVS